MTRELSLRERKKLATREALSHAAWAMMMARGLDAVTPETIAEAADVSPRTFRNYFASREEAILHGLARRGESFAEALRARPAGESVWDSLVHVVTSVVGEFAGEREDVLVLMKAVRDNPAMLAQHLVAFERTHRHLADAIAERLGIDAAHDVVPRLLAGVVSVAIRTSFEIWAESSRARPLPDLIRESLAQLREGFPLGAAPAA